MNTPIIFVLSLVSTWGTVAEEESLETRAHQILTAHCFGCHGKDGEAEGGFDYVVDRDQLVSEKKVIPGKPEDSLLLKRMTARRKPMPPLDDDRVKSRPSSAEIALLERWIKAGAAPFLPAKEGAHPPKDDSRSLDVSDRAIFEAIARDLQGVPQHRRRHRRYFSLAVQVRGGLIGSELRLMQAGLSKLLNSLSWRHEPVLPKVLLDGALLAIDLTDLNWDQMHAWDQILSNYPYGLKFDGEKSPRDLATAAHQAYEQTRTELPVIRLDWFLANASQPGSSFTGQEPYRKRGQELGRPLYESLLDLPDNARELEKKLNVDLADDFRRGTTVRVGMAKSGVSNQSRVIERHRSIHGAYWISWDFKTDEGRQRLPLFPLGPLEIAGERFAGQAFEHDGGEIIFNLPNGLQAYMLINAKGDAIPEGPADVVRDKDETAGRNTLIVNGLSCIGCHSRGMRRDVKDEIRDGTAFGGVVYAKVQEVYPPREEVLSLMDTDKERFRQGMKAACGPYLLVGADASKDILDFPEPVSSFAKPFLRKQLTLAEAARELGVDTGSLSTAIRLNDRLRPLRTWLNEGGTLSRRAWESQEGLISLYQITADVLDLGKPKLVRFHTGGVR